MQEERKWAHEMGAHTELMVMMLKPSSGEEALEYMSSCAPEVSKERLGSTRGRGVRKLLL